MPSEDLRVRVRNRGKVSSTLEFHAERYRERYPDRDVRYVYDPVHKPELSGTLGRQAMGYEFVTKGQLGMASTSDEENERIRVGDLVLMSVDKETADAIRDDLRQRAEDQRKLVDRQFRDSIEAEAEALAQKSGGKYKQPLMKPMGGVAIEERLHEYDIDPNAKREK